MSTKEFIKNVNLLIQYLTAAYYKLRERMPAHDYAEDDVYEAIYSVEQQIAAAQLSKKIHRLFKIGDNEFEEMLYANDSIEPVYIGRKIQHTVKYHESVYSIAASYNVAWEDICQENGIEPGDISYGMVLNIPTLRTQPSLVVYEDVSTFDSHANETVLGKDIRLDFTFENNDVKTVEGEDCLRQGVQNISNISRGEHPFFPILGIANMVGEDFPEEIRRIWKVLAIRESFLTDGRITDINIVAAQTDDDGNDYIETEVVAVTRKTVGI